MKLRLYITILALATVGISTSFAQETEEKKPITLTPVGTPKLKLEETEFNFGEIEQGETVSHVFKFVNDGSAPLVIEHISTPCGCTTPKWSKDSIPPGGAGEITVNFNSTGKMGRQVKNLSIRFNSELSPESITITGNVKPASK